MSLLSRVARTVGQRLTRNPEARSERARVLARTHRFLNDNLNRVADTVRGEHRKGRSDE